MAPSEKFTATYDQVGAMGKKLKEAKKPGPSNDEQLQLYAYAKIAQGNNIADATKPGMFDLTGKAKYNKWDEIAKTGITPKDAEEKYITLGDEILAKYDN